MRCVQHVGSCSRMSDNQTIKIKSKCINFHVGRWCEWFKPPPLQGGILIGGSNPSRSTIPFQFECGAVVAQLTVNQLVTGPNPVTRAMPGWHSGDCASFVMRNYQGFESLTWLHSLSDITSTWMLCHQCTNVRWCCRRSRTLTLHTKTCTSCLVCMLQGSIP